MKKLLFYFSLISILTTSFSLFTYSQKTHPTATKINASGTLKDFTTAKGDLRITVDDKQVDINDYALLGWIINDGKDVIYTKRDGSGGYENEGESLWIYNVGRKDKRKILSAYYMIDAAIEVKLSNGKRAIVVRMSDGGAGNSYISIVDPTRGEVFFRKLAEVINIKRDKITLGIFNSGSWDYDATSENNKFKRKDNIFLVSSDPKPYKKETYNLKKIIENNEVIFNENSFAKYDPDNEGLKRVNIYLWRYNDVFKNKNFILSAVPRYVNPKAPLKPALESLFSKALKHEENYGMGNPTFGMKFEGVVLKNGTAHIKFSQPPNQTNYGSLGPFIFEEAIKKTALQFPTVKSVRVCAIGETFFDAYLDKPFPKCSK